MFNSWAHPETVSRELEVLLPQLGLLFNGRRGEKLPNGNVDLGFNCFGKAFVTTFLGRLRGLPVDTCSGEAVVMEKESRSCYTIRVNPHCWAGTPATLPTDLSFRDFKGRKFLPIVSGKAFDRTSWRIAVTTSEGEFGQFLANRLELPDGAYLLYRTMNIRSFNCDDLKLGGVALRSNSTLRITALYPGNDVIAKAILHLHLVARGARHPLIAQTQKNAWNEIARWRVDAVGELTRLLREAEFRIAAGNSSSAVSVQFGPVLDNAWENAPAPPCLFAG